MKYVNLEVISGLGVGGAEKSFLNRLVYEPANSRTIVLNTRPDLDFWELPAHIKEVKIYRYKLSFLSKTFRLVTDINPNLIIIRSPVDLVMISLIRFVTLKKWKILYEAHSTKLSKYKSLSIMIKPLFYLCLKSCVKVIAVSKSVAVGDQCKGAKDLVVHYLGAEIDILERSNPSLTFVFVGRMNEIKQPLFLLEAVVAIKHELRRAEALVKFVGDGKFLNDVKEKIVSADLDSIASVLGYRENLSDIYANADYLVSCSLFEGLPITFFEAKISGLKIITTPSSGDFDILSNEDQVLHDFNLPTLCNAMLNALKIGSIPSSERYNIQKRNEWMSAKSCSQEYYQLLQSFGN